jgi:protein-S-isoprenylcysteine O-methyltransferase Ste14
MVFLIILAAALFLSAGRLDWSAGWFFFGIVFLVQILTAVMFIPANSELLVERAQLGAGAKKLDVLLALLMAYSTVFSAIIAGLDARYGWSGEISWAVIIAAAAVGMLGTGFTLWAMLANRFFSGVVRIQVERGHHVVMTGPYRWVRHPGYAGALLTYWATPILLDSKWTFIPVILLTAVLIVRTALEDRTLQAELPGYQEYAQSTRFRLVPGIW